MDPSCEPVKQGVGLWRTNVGRRREIKRMEMEMEGAGRGCTAPKDMGEPLGRPVLSGQG